MPWYKATNWIFFLKMQQTHIVIRPSTNLQQETWKHSTTCPWIIHPHIKPSDLNRTVFPDVVSLYLHPLVQLSVAWSQARKIGWGREWWHSLSLSQVKSQTLVYCAHPWAHACRSAAIALSSNSVTMPGSMPSHSTWAAVWEDMSVVAVNS